MQRFYHWLYRQTWVPDNLLTLWDKYLCEYGKVHGYSCRGRADHYIPGKGLIHPNRWL